ncbi:hypothetical protein, partial [Streptomyces jumonjinensis]
TDPPRLPRRLELRPAPPAGAGHPDCPSPTGTYGIVIPPATTPPTALMPLQARVLALSDHPNTKIKTTG